MPPSVSQDTIRLVHLYISQALPLPPYLLSKSLLQRHHFLNISPDDYVAYLAWPGSSPELLAEALIGLSSPPDDQDILYTITYTSDEETTLAHVSVASTDPASNSFIRLVFTWDNDDATWKYHNLGLMPFPQDSVASVDQAMSQTSFDQSEMDADSYWGTPDQLDEVCDNDRKPRSNAEDDYWARYSTIQGSGDSTSPSPSRKQNRVDHTYEEHDRVMVSYPVTKTEIYNPLEPPSPELLARRLADLSASVRFGDASFKSDSVSRTLSPEHPSDSSAIGDGSDPKSSLVCKAEHPSDVYLGDAIRAIYHLWRLSRPKGDPREAFIEIVRQSIYA
ncbi:hypothetical protein F5887DRAFT_1070270 [Amanita rubescens]|nr:hypothetical protein F5887DRAFT_1070270 [Amanita rubescens]